MPQPDTGDGHLALQSCQHALQLGRFAGENAARDLLGMPLIPYRQLRYVTHLDLGRSGAVSTNGWERAVRLTGEEAKALKRRINTEVIYPPSMASRERLLALSVPTRPRAAPPLTAKRSHTRTCGSMATGKDHRSLSSSTDTQHRNDTLGA
jgi:NADH dehydrogenase FAD-containing subunit